MNLGQLYCTMDELISDLGLNGEQAGLFARIQSASRFIYRRIGQFIPTTETRDYQGNGATSQYVDFLLSLTTLTNNGTTITDYDLYPLNAWWENGPYTRIEADVSWDVVVATGSWGKWSETESLGETVTQLVGATTLAVADGSKISPGMALALGSEQELVTGWNATATAATSLLNEAVDASEEEIDVDNGTEFNPGEVIQLSTEDCYIRMVRSNTLVVARGWNGTTKQTHAENDAIGVYRTVNVTRAVNGTTAAAHTTAALSRYVPPADVNWLCRQMAGLAFKKAQSGFSGKVGNAELGEVFYYNEFPSQIKEVARNYRVTQL